MARLGDKFRAHARALGDGAPGPDLGGPNRPGARGPMLAELLVRDIEPDPDQPRKNLGDVSDLAASIREIGLIQPIIVTVAGYERYRILAGERRFAAARLAGLERVPAIVRTVEEHQRLELQLVENLHRKDLSPFEEAETYRRLIADFGLTHETLGRRLGKTQVSVTETLRILDLPDQIRREAQETREGGEAEESARRVSKTLLLEIARRPREEQMRLWREARQGRLTSRQLRALRAAPDAASGAARGSARRPAADSAGTRFRYPIVLQEQDGCVTVELRRGKPRLEDIVAALEEALAVERARLPE